jgi:glutathione S-transferase
LKNKSKELLERNPYGKVPVLEDGEAVIYESAVIDEYLEEKYPAVPLMPKDPYQRARARIWIDFANTRLQAAAGNIAHDHQVEKNKEQLKQHLATLDKEMQNRDFIAGAYSLADITYIPFFCRLDRYEATIGDDTPKVKAWMNRLLNRPVVRNTP